MEMSGIDYTKKEIDYHIDRVKYYNDIPNRDMLLQLLEEWSRELGGDTQSRVEELEEENNELKDKLEELEDEAEDLRQENRELLQENERLELVISELEERIDDMEQV